MKSILERIICTYVRYVSIFMIIVALIAFFGMSTGVDVFKWISDTFPKSKHVVGWIFMFGVYNILICGLAGIVMVIMRGHRLLGLLAIVAAILYYGMFWQIGDAF